MGMDNDNEYYGESSSLSWGSDSRTFLILRIDTNRLVWICQLHIHVSRAWKGYQTNLSANRIIFKRKPPYQIVWFLFGDIGTRINSNHFTYPLGRAQSIITTVGIILRSPRQPPFCFTANLLTIKKKHQNPHFWRARSEAARSAGGLNGSQARSGCMWRRRDLGDHRSTPQRRTIIVLSLDARVETNSDDLF